MPWTPSDTKRHSKSANPKKWSKIANAVLEKTGDEGKAIRIANAKAKRNMPTKGVKK